jgi:hypothetical protein
MSTKKCKKCGRLLELSCFLKSKVHLDGHLWVCKDCTHAYQARWRKTEGAISTKRKYDLEYRERPGVRNRFRLRVAEYRRNNPHSGWAQGTIMWHKRGGMKVNVSLAEIVTLAKKSNVCLICGKELRWTQGNGAKKLAHNSPTLDRINNEMELRNDNIQVICYTCNTTKHNRTMKEFVQYCKMVVDKFDPKTGELS